jgi:hypothetical protein
VRKTGSFLGLPYDWHRPTWERTKASLWNPDEPRLFTPMPFGWGRAINVARLFGSKPAMTALDKQVGMIPQLWWALHDYDETDNRPLIMTFKFIFDAPSEVGAAALVDHLRKETDYAIEAHSLKKGMLSKRSWMVRGTTEPITVTLDSLKEWVAWMVTAGASHGQCKFGWNAEIS